MPKDPSQRPLTRLPTLDGDPERLLGLWKQAKRIPEKYTSWDQISGEFVDLVRTQGMSQKDARKQMGIEYRNILGSPVLNINESSTGDIRGLDKRAIREDYNIATENFLKEREGQASVDAEKSRLLTDWNKLSELERRTMQDTYNKQFHRGHGNAALAGGSIGIDNMWPEIGRYNVAHGPQPRWPQGVMDTIGVTRSDLQDRYERQLQSEGLGVVGRPSNELAIAADEYMREDTTKTYTNTPIPRSAYMPRNIKGVASPKPGPATVTDPSAFDPNRLEMTVRLQQDLIDQGASREAIDRFNRNQSAALSEGDATKQSGPVRVIQSGTQIKPVRVASGNRTRTIPVRQVGQGGGIVTSPSVTRGRTAAAIATRQPIPTAKPKPQARAMPRSSAASSRPATPASNVVKLSQLSKGRIEKATNANLGDMPGIGLFQQQFKLAD